MNVTSFASNPSRIIRARIPASNDKLNMNRNVTCTKSALLICSSRGSRSTTFRSCMSLLLSRTIDSFFMNVTTRISTSTLSRSSALQRMRTMFFLRIFSSNLVFSAMFSNR